MVEIVPEGEDLRKATRWISDRRKEEDKNLNKLVEEACIRFDLSPKDSEFLIRFFSKEK